MTQHVTCWVINDVGVYRRVNLSGCINTINELNNIFVHQVLAQNNNKSRWKGSNKNLTNLNTVNLVTFLELCYPKANQNASFGNKCMACDVVLVARGQQVPDNVINDAIDEQLQAATTTVPHSSVDDWLTDIKMHRYQRRDGLSRPLHTLHVEKSLL